MALKIRSQEDFFAGLMFVAFGVFTFYMAHKYSMGTTGRMGPGYFPRGIGAIMTFLGAALTVRSLNVDGEKVGPFPWRALIMLSIALSAYAYLMSVGGFIPALVALILFSSLSGGEFNLREVAVLTIMLIIGAWALFIYALDLPFVLFWWQF
ncbi:MAG: tripartite tricarboxylate transporter TctB family protein [Pseudomonadota bacterium]